MVRVRFTAKLDGTVVCFANRYSGPSLAGMNHEKHCYSVEIRFSSYPK